MEQLEGISEGDWSCLSSMCTAEEANFMSQLLTNSCAPTGNNHCSYYSSHVGDTDSTNFFSFTQGSGSSESLEDYYYYYFSDNNNTVMLTDHGISSYLVDGNGEETDLDYHQKPVLPGGNSQVIAGYETPVLEDSKEDKRNEKERYAKRARPSIEIPKCKRNLKARNSLSASASNNEEENAHIGRKNSSNCCSDDESNASQELNGVRSSNLSPRESVSTKMTVKTRANKGASTDPQSLYARKRRERINERLRILQTLVPNGTKVDISTMLEEAVRYVKFLQLQIKLLSSDDLWMYAPIAYNGMDVSLDLKITPPTKLP